MLASITPRVLALSSILHMILTHLSVGVRVDQQGDIDVIEYVEAYMEVLTALGDAENDLYSANFADYSGGGGTKVSEFSLASLQSWHRGNEIPVSKE